MEYVQERVATLHDFDGHEPDVPTAQAAVVVPMTEREYAGLAAERVLSELESVDPARVVVPLRAAPGKVAAFREWIDGFQLDATVLWCDGPRLEELLSDAGLDGERGKGRDVWLGLGQALDAKFVIVHDADTRSYDRRFVRRLLFPLTYEYGYEFVKGYYARVENARLYGRLFRLFYVPLVRALQMTHRSPLLEFLAAFRYALAGEFAATSDLVSRMRLQRTWGLEVGVLAEAFDAVGFDGAAQVDLGTYEHDHRAVSGPTGLSEMSEGVGAALFRAVEESGHSLEYDSLRAEYRETAADLIRAYDVDAAFNGLEYDRQSEQEQVESYAEAIVPPPPDTRLPAWDDAPVSPAAVRDAAEADARGVGADRDS